MPWTPHICPMCDRIKAYYGMLVEQGHKPPKCPNCDSALIPISRSVGRAVRQPPATR